MPALNQDPTRPQPDLLVTGTCVADQAGPYYFGVVNIIDGGTITFSEQPEHPGRKTEFWASAIIIENGGTLKASARVGDRHDLPYGLYQGTLTIYLYGGNHGSGPPCLSPTPRPCGIDVDAWDKGQTTPQEMFGVTDYFYKYGVLHGDWYCRTTAAGPVYFDSNKGVCVNSSGQATNDKPPYFGDKVLAVSYGGTLDLKGLKGADYVNDDPESSGFSWMRLTDGSYLAAGAKTLVLERAPLTWAKDDEIVITTTDYLPSHSEKLKIVGDDQGDTYNGGVAVRFRAIVDDADSKPDAGLQWPHNGTRYGGPLDDPAKRLATRLPDRIREGLDHDLLDNGVETRAAVALLTRSIRIVSGGDTAGTAFGHSLRKAVDPINPYYSYGAHMVVRQGFKRVAVQGVEFVQMGQGGRLGHYPVHFHMARQTPKDNAYIKDSSINESMTRWIVLHSTQGVTLARNVGYKSIGHGFYLEDGTETDNKFHSNIGIFARAAVANVDPNDSTKIVPNRQNPRKIPGILADNTNPVAYRGVPGKPFIYRSDVENPTVFWFTNGWNDFIGNMAAGAGTCGAAYWFVPVANSDHIEVGATHDHMTWKGYAGLQKTGTDINGVNAGLAGSTPLKSFYKNYATSTMHSFQTTGDAPECLGVIAADVLPGNAPVLRAVPSMAPRQARHMVPKSNPDHEEADTLNDPYYPHIAGLRQPVRCDPTGDGYDCSKITQVCSHVPSDNCAVTILDHFTSSFHWAHGNVSAIWLRPQWYLLTNSVLSDVQNGGVTFITGGDYTHSSVIDGYWGLAKSSVFIGNTQDPTTNPYASNLGPFNTLSKLKCDTGKATDQYCLNADETVSMPTTGFFTNQRLANIYDGPSYQDTNAYLDIKTAECPRGDSNSGCMYASNHSFLRLKTKPGDPNSTCYLPNAAIAWKQPNGFFYPPAFHTKNLYFDNVDLRHYVINPLFKAPDNAPNFGQGGTYLTDPDAVKAQYCVEEAKYDTLFGDFTSIDRQTVLNDTDGTLTGLSNSLPDSKDPLQQRLKQTLSINEDSFFSAPRDTAECGSAARGTDDGKGGNADAKNACAPPVKDKPPMTARTSPYDYVATILFHRSSGETDIWDADCTNQGCYGVPLYRQYLTSEELKRWKDYNCSDQKNTRKSKPECRWPFIRMSGEALSQRETLTINNGTYYVDTTVSQPQQENENYTTKTPRSRNVFKAGETYYMFFTYAKTSTVQTYQIYVGTDFNNKTMFKPGRIDVDGFNWLDKSPSEAWVKAEKAADGILTVNVDFSSTKVDPSPESAGGLCQPRTFCTSGIDSETKKPACVSNLKPHDPVVLANKNFGAQNAKVCQTWAAKDLDCPPIIRKNGQWTEGGCYAFAFTLPPTSFSANNDYHRPEPGPFPATSGPKKQGLPDWTTKLTQGVANQEDTCFYPKVPGTDCKLP